MIGGHAAGVAASMAARGNRTVQNVHRGQLQQTLRRQRQVIDFIPGQPEKWSDPKGGTGGPPEF